MNDPFSKLMNEIGYTETNFDGITHFTANQRKIREFLERYQNPWLDNLETLCHPVVDLVHGVKPKPGNSFRVVLVDTNTYRYTENTITMNRFRLNEQVVNHIYVSKIEFINFDAYSADERIREMNFYDTCIFSYKADPLVFFFVFLIPRELYPRVMFKVYNRSLCINQSAVTYDNSLSCISMNDAYAYDLKEAVYFPREIVGMNAFFKGVKLVRAENELIKTTFANDMERQLSAEANYPRAYYTDTLTLNTCIRLIDQDKVLELIIKPGLHLFLPAGYRLEKVEKGWTLTTAVKI